MALNSEPDLLARIIAETIGPLTPEILASLPDVAKNCVSNRYRLRKSFSDIFKPIQSKTSVTQSVAKVDILDQLLPPSFQPVINGGTNGFRIKKLSEIKKEYEQDKNKDNSKATPDLPNASKTSVVSNGSTKRPLSVREDNNKQNAKKELTKKRKTMSDEEKRRIDSSFPRYDLLRILQKHSRRADPKDFKTPIWDIKFRPTGRKYCGSHLVATAGGSFVNVIDLKTGTVMGRYEDEDFGETFNCLVWRDFIVNTRNGMIRDLSIICAGGTRRDNYHKVANIVFVNGDDPTDHLKIGSHSHSVNRVEFHPIKKDRLFTGSYDRKVMIWSMVWNKVTQISPLSAIQVDKLMEIECNNRVLNLVIAHRLDYVVVTGEDGVVLFKEPKTRSDEVNAWTVDLPEMTEKSKLVDGLVMVGRDSNLIAFRHQKWIIVADLNRMIESTKRPNFKGVVPLIVVNRLQYCSAKCDYFYMSNESRILCCGDAYGRLLVYYIRDSVLQAYDKENPIEAIRILPKPDLRALPIKKDPKTGKPMIKDLLVNIATISPNHEYIVGGTNANLICVWKRRDPTPKHSTPKSSTHSSKSLTNEITF